VLLALLVALAYGALNRYYGREGATWWLIAGWVAVLLNVLRAGLGHLYRLDRLPFDRFDVGLEDDRALPGGAFRLAIDCRARREVRIDRIAAELQCINRRVSESGTSESVLQSIQDVLAEDLPLARGEARHFASELRVPDGAAASFRDSQDRIRWRVSLVATVRGWGDLRDEFEMTVAPG
jgi:hypothetical protein